MRNLIFLLLLAAPVPAAPILETPDASSLFNAQRNATFILPFSLRPDDTAYIVINAVQGLITRGPGELYGVTDLLSVFVANNAFALAPQASPSTPWTGELASVFIPSSATTGLASGQIQIDYERFDLDPFFNPLAASLGTATLTANFSLNITDPLPTNPIPEPGFALPLFLAATASLLAAKHREVTCKKTRQ